MPELAAHLERVAKELSERLVTEAFVYLCDGEIFSVHKATEILAAALAACAREAKWRDRWRKDALAMVPSVYSERGLQQKYLKMDNEAAGIDACADALDERISELTVLAERAVGEKAGEAK